MQPEHTCICLKRLSGHGCNTRSPASDKQHAARASCCRRSCRPLKYKDSDKQTNGKSANVNWALRQGVYGNGRRPQANEVIVIFDCDHRPEPHFFTRVSLVADYNPKSHTPYHIPQYHHCTHDVMEPGVEVCCSGLSCSTVVAHAADVFLILPAACGGAGPQVLQVMSETRADLVLTPQFFSNTEAGADIFNNDNIQFWKVSHPSQPCGTCGLLCTAIRVCITGPVCIL